MGFLLAKGEPRGALTFDDLLTAVVIAVVYLSLTIFIITSEKRTKANNLNVPKDAPARVRGM